MATYEVRGTDVLDIDGYRPARRWNEIINTVNCGGDPEKIDPPLGEKEWEDYIRMKTNLDAENERIRKECKELGIEPWEAGYDLVELDWE